MKCTDICILCTYIMYKYVYIAHTFSLKAIYEMFIVQNAQYFSYHLCKMHIKIVVFGYFIHKIHDQFIYIFSCQTIFPLFFGQNSQKFCARCFYCYKI